MTSSKSGAIPLTYSGQLLGGGGINLRYARQVISPEACQLPIRQCVLYALTWQMVTFTLLAAQLVLVCTLGPLTMFVGLAGLTGLFIYRPLAGITVFVQVLLYQNLFLSIFSCAGIDRTSFSAFQGFAFSVVVCMATVATFRIAASAPQHKETAGLTKWTWASIAVIVVYTCYGAIGSSPISALIYSRSSAAMLLAMIVGLDVGRTWSYRTVAIIFISSVAVGLLLAVVEYTSPHFYYAVSHARDYYHVKVTANDKSEISRNVDDVISALVVPWFNVTGGAGGFVSVRILGSNMEPISYAYIIANFGLIAATVGRPALAILALSLLTFAGVKGPLIMLAMTLAIFALWWIVRKRTVILFASLALLATYVALGIRTGMASGDFHVIGLLGGVNGFLKVPWGHGIGVGGNLSEAALKGGLDWQVWQKTGVDFALESAVGVLLYQMGVGATAVFVPIARLLRRGLSVAAPTPVLRTAPAPLPIDLLFIGIAVTLFNGFFQEEAYSPYALGLLTLLGGIAASNRTIQPVVQIKA
jgi:hypothetical protein